MIETFEAFILSLFQIFNWSIFSMMLIGNIIGFAVGILPGLGGPTTLALMLPFIFKMKAVEAFAFLLGMAAVTGTTGDITSIIFGVPGESASAATIIDGHAMAKRGEAGRALGAAMISSLIGAVFGAFVLGMAIPVVRPIVLSLGSPEFFMLTILGISFIASLSGETLIKGFIAGGLGLVLSSVGMETISGVQRYTFGQHFLWDGIGVIPITIGLFALPEIIDLAIKGTSISQNKIGKLSGVMDGVRDTFHHWWLVIRCSAIGTYVGILPGMGSSVGQWVAYAHAVQSSSDKEKFGKGAVEGVLAPGAANNSTLGGALIPTVAFGIPGSTLTAILLGAFIIQGIVPGPNMLITEQKGGHLTLVFSFVWVIVISNIIAVGTVFLILNQLIKITNVRGNLVIPFILFLCYLGAFAEKNAFQDLLLVLLFGLAGWMMVNLNWPRPPLILGLVLGSVAEQRLFLSTSRYGMAWLGRPGVIILFIIIMAIILYPIIRERYGDKKKEIKNHLTLIQNTAVRNRGNGFHINRVMLFSFLVAGIFGYALWESRGWGFRAGLFPWTIGIPCFVLAIAQFMKDGWSVQKGKSMDNMENSEDADQGMTPDVIYRRTVDIFTLIFAFLGAIWLLGFSIAIPLSFFFYLKIYCQEKWMPTIIVTALAIGFFNGLFIYVLQLPFPVGQLFLWTGLSI